MANQIKAGDVVRLKSGGTPMTVAFITSLESGSSAHVIWMTKHDERLQAVIAVDALDKVSTRA